MLDRELQQIQDQMLTMGSRTSRAILDAVDALQTHQLDSARQLIVADRVINEQRFSLERDCLTLIATQNPIARDLRTITAVLEIITELERIGDYAKGIGKITLMVGAEPLLPTVPDLPQMAVKAQGMLRRALLAFTRRDTELAHQTAKLDDEVDNLYNKIYQELMAYIIADPAVVDHANYMLWAAHNLERTADRALNICERVIFTVTGQIIELDDAEKWQLVETPLIDY